MPLYDYQCRRCGNFEQMGRAEDRFVPCVTCDRRAERVWLSRGERRFLERPIVLHRHADGQWGVPGRADVPTPPGAERVEIRSMQEYNRVMKQMNAEEGARTARHDERVHAAREHAIKLGREKLVTRLAQSDNPADRDLIRSALAHYDTAAQAGSHRPMFCEALEMDASNRDGHWERLSRERK